MTSFENLLCLFNTDIKEQDGTFVIEVPENEVDIGALQPDQSYRVGILSSAVESGAVTEPDQARNQTKAEPPVEEGETIDVEIEDVGEQGDGIARIGPGYIVFVPGTDIGERVTVEVTDVRQNFAFADVVDRPY